MQTHERYIKRCLELAAKGKGQVHPNPMVGCVIVHNGKIIGEGYHRRYGEAHAEVNAIAAVKNKDLLRHSTLYVSLEPCNHVGKTPACSKLIVEHKIPEVVIAMEDPFEQVNGAGIQTLKNAGVKITKGVLEEEAKELNRVFLTFHVDKKPFVSVKYARSANRFISAKNGKPVQLTNDLSNLINHQRRSEIDAIAIGYNTALNDDPSLTPRYWYGKTPLRVVFDPKDELPGKLTIFNDGEPTLVVTTTKGAPKNNAEYLFCESEQTMLSNLMDYLYEKGLAHLLVEGGSKLIRQFENQQLVNEYWVYTNPEVEIVDGVKEPIFEKSNSETYTLNGNILQKYQ